jgi:hypothetical protein
MTLYPSEVNDYRGWLLYNICRDPARALISARFASWSKKSNWLEYDVWKLLNLFHLILIFPVCTRSSVDHHSNKSYTTRTRSFFSHSMCSAVPRTLFSRHRRCRHSAWSGGKYLHGRPPLDCSTFDHFKMA